ncbi:MAG: Na+/proline symporter [Cyanobacteria bacterium P01_F01_bin.53]
MSLMGIVVLVAMLLASAAFALLGAARHTGAGADLENYMVSRNQISGPMAMATVTASAMGAWILFSPPEAGSAFGGLTAILGYCLGSAAAVFLFVFVGPRLRRIMPWGHSLNEYVRYRFGSPNNSGDSGRVSGAGLPMYWLTVGVMLLYMFVYLTAELTAIAQALQLIVAVPLLVTSLVVMLAVFLYTTVGGLKATIVTDAVQFVLIVPLLLLCFGATVWSLGGFGASFEPVAANLPAFLSFGNIDGLRFGATLLIAIVAAELFNQGNWQRVYACRDDQTVRRSFLGASLIILPMIFISGLLGLMAAGLDFSGPTAFFDLLFSLSIPTWVATTLILLALALVMSSLDTLLNGISSVFTSDLLRLSGPDSEAKVLSVSRRLLVVVCIPAVVIAAKGYSVLYLFFIADLLCAALLFPIVFSLYNRHQTANNAFWSSIIGIVVGVTYFPRPDFTPMFNIPGGGDLLNSFASALVASTLVTLVWNAIDKNNKNTNSFNYKELEQVQSYSVEASNVSVPPAVFK